MALSPADDLSVAQRVDLSCDQFEEQFQRGVRPQLEEFLGQAVEPFRLQLFRGLLELELELRRGAGEQLDRADYVRRFPDYAPVIDLVFADVMAGLSGRSPRTPAAQGSSVQMTAADTSRGPRSSEPKALAVPTEIARFQILQPLGEGAFGAVYRARDPQLDREVAIKVPRTESLGSQEDRDRFLREARAAAGLHHPHICPVYEVGTTASGRDYIVMAMIDGKPLSRIVQSGQKLTDRQIAGAIRKLALALDEAHQKGVIHRDLKPANIMINRKGEPVIMDFGLARRSSTADPQLSHSGQIMGTPAYMSPEQARGDSKRLGPSTDIYSLGVVMYELMCGQRPFSGTVTEVIGKILHVDAPPPSQFRPQTDRRLEAICLKAIAKQPADRYASMKDFASALADFQKAGSSPAATASATEAVEPGPQESLHTKQIARLVDAVSADVEDKINRAADRAAARVAGNWRPPYWAYLAGSGLAGIIVMLGIFLFVRSGPATIIIQVPLPPDVDLKDTSLAFFLDQKAITADELGKPIELTHGDHELLIKRGDQVVRLMKFTVRVEGKESKIEIKDDSPPRGTELATSDGFEPLFNGRDLNGWQGARDKYEVVNGVLRCKSGHRGILYTVEEFDDFAVRLEFKFTPGANNGLAIRYPGDGDPAYTGFCEVQLLDSDSPEAGKLDPRQVHGSAYGLVGAKRGHLKPAGEWNSQQVSVRGTTVTVELNGTVILDSDLALVTQFIGGAPYAQKNIRKGYFGLAGHTGEVEFRNIRIKKLNPPGPDDRAGFVPLFNSNSLAGWQGRQDLWSLRDGVLTGRPTAGNFNTCLFSERSYGDFELKFQVRIGENDNSGVQIRSEVLDSDRWTARGPQCDVGDSSGNYWGGVYGENLQGWMLKPATMPAVNRGDWNDYTIRCMGRKVAIQVNGVTTVDGDIPEMSATGRLAFQIHRTNSRPVEFRNLRVREIASRAIPADAKRFGGHAYKFFPEQTSWKSARARCESLGGHLAIIESAEENAFVAQLIADAGGHASWIGLTDEHQEGDWRWVDGNPRPYQNWYASNPNNKGNVEHYGVMTQNIGGIATNWQWSDQPNEPTQVKPGYVCEWADDAATGRTSALDPDRAAAEWVLAIGGKVKVNGEDRTINEVRELPPTGFQLTLVALDRNAKVTDAGLECLKGCKHLAFLGLENTIVSDAGLANFRDCTKLLSLGLGNEVRNSRVTDAGVAWFRNCKDLRLLYLYNTRITDVGLASFYNCKNLVWLDLINTKVTDTGLAPFRECKDLKVLTLGYTQVTDEGLAHFQDSTELTELILNNTRISDAGLPRLAGLSALRKLNLRKTRVTARGIDTLHKAIPLCRIEWDGGVVEPAAAASRRRNAGWSRPNERRSAMLVDSDEMTHATVAGTFDLEQALATPGIGR